LRTLRLTFFNRKVREVRRKVSQSFDLGIESMFLKSVAGGESVEKAVEQKKKWVIRAPMTHLPRFGSPIFRLNTYPEPSEQFVCIRQSALQVDYLSHLWISGKIGMLRNNSRDFP
jgi:hypothetical protein